MVEEMLHLRAVPSVVNDKKEIFGWVMYDWANSAFMTTVVTSLLGPYILMLASSSQSPFRILYWTIEPAAIFPAAVSISVVLQVFLLPILGTIADFTRLKKKMLLGFAYAGAAATILLFLARHDMPLIGTNGAVLFASLIIIIANLCFGAAIVFYNSFLTDIASPDRRDRVSSYGFAMGYLGGGLLLLCNLLLISLLDDTTLGIRISLASAGLWWLIFTLAFPQRHLQQRDPAYEPPEDNNLFAIGVQQIRRTLTQMRARYPQTLRYLIAYLVYNDGIQTVIVVATSFAVAELGVEPKLLLLFVLMIQFVGIGGALVFGWLARYLGAKRSILLSLVVWAGVVIYAYLFLSNELQLFVLGFLVAVVLGGSQALSRSLFSQMIPKKHESEYFGFYEISERGTSWLGPLAFAAAVQLTGSQRSAILSLIVFFILGLILLSRVRVGRAMMAAGNDPSEVVL
jgi:UMF1 family MFS transporter